MNRTSNKIQALALELTRKRRNKKNRYSKLIVTQNTIALRLGKTISTIQRFESRDFMNMSLGDFIELLKLMEENGIDTHI